jgi:hypothetical protein
MTFIQIDAVTSDRLLIAIWRMFDWCGNGTLHPKWICRRWNRNPCFNHTKNWFKCFGSHFGINSFVLSAAWFFGISTALYSIVTYFSAVKSLDYVTNGIEHYTSLHIISAKKKLNF